MEVELANGRSWRRRYGRRPIPRWCPLCRRSPATGSVASWPRSVTAPIGRSWRPVVAGTGGSGTPSRSPSTPRGVLRVPDDLGMAEAAWRTAARRCSWRPPASSTARSCWSRPPVAASARSWCNSPDVGARVVGAAGGKAEAGAGRRAGQADRRLPRPGVARAGPDRAGRWRRVAFDGVGGTIGCATFDLVRDGGRFVPFGMASGEVGPDPATQDAARRHLKVVHLGPPTPADVARVTRRGARRRRRRPTAAGHRSTVPCSQTPPPRTPPSSVATPSARRCSSSPPPGG